MQGHPDSATSFSQPESDGSRRSRPPAVRVGGVVKRFGSTTALAGVDLEVPEGIVCHSFKPLKKIELASVMAECVEELAGEQNVEFAFLNVGSDHPFAISDLAQEGQRLRSGATKGRYAPNRGTIVQIGRYQRLLATSGPTLIKRPGAPLPHPLHMRSSAVDVPRPRSHHQDCSREE